MAPTETEPLPRGTPPEAPTPSAEALSEAAVDRWPWMISTTTVDELLRLRARTTPGAPLLLDASGASLSCAEVDERVSRVAAALAGHGIGAGSRVAWQLPTRVGSILVMLALRRLGAIQAPIIPLYREREVAAVVETTGAQFLLHPGTWGGVGYAELARDALARLPADRVAVRLVEIPHDAPESDPADLVPAEADPYLAAWVYFTSGSSGRPKGARHSDTTLLVTARSFGGIGELNKEPGEVGGVAYPVAHIGGIEFLITALACGFPLLLLERFVPDQSVELFRRYGVTNTGGAPPFYAALVAVARARPAEQALPALRTLKGGGAPCPPSMVGEVADALGAVLAHDYGMTEAPMIAVGCPSDPPEILAATDGRPIPDDRIRLMGESGEVEGHGVVGEVQVSGPGVCLGYTDPAEQEAAFTADGWFRTGDLATFHPSGHVEVLGRLKDMIIRKGENIAPQEIESLLGGHPAVAEVAVIGLADEQRGERVCAVVVPAPDSTPPTLDELVVWLTTAGLMRQKLPEQLEIIDVLPRTGLAKVAKPELRRRFAAGQ
jgi:cyclohexanecarboxylate-CoA ligase